MSRPLLLGHRGARRCKSIAENTLASFDRALADGCDGVEFDLRLTADGEAVVSHDSNVGGLEIAHAEAWQLPALPRLCDVLERYRKAFLDIELKVPGLERVIVEELRNCDPRRFVVSSFLPEVVKAVRAANTTIALGLICQTRTQLRRWNELPIDYVIPHYGLVDEALVRLMKDAGKRILVWTVNAKADMRQLAGCGVDGIISDDTTLLCRTLKN